MTTKTERVPIQDLDHFVNLLVEWHTKKVNTVKHMIEIPEGTEVTIDDGKAMQLTGDFRKGFQLGLAIALSELGDLPFDAEMEEPAPAVKH